MSSHFMTFHIKRYSLKTGLVTHNYDLAFHNDMLKSYELLLCDRISELWLSFSVMTQSLIFMTILHKYEILAHDYDLQMFVIKVA